MGAQGLRGRHQHQLCTCSLVLNIRLVSSISPSAVVQGLIRKPEDEDVRAKILRHEGNSDQFKQFTAAYNKTQPKPMYAEEEKEEEET